MFPVWLPSVLLLLDRDRWRVGETVSEQNIVNVLEHSAITPHIRISAGERQ